MKNSEQTYSCSLCGATMKGRDFEYFCTNKKCHHSSSPIHGCTPDREGVFCLDTCGGRRIESVVLHGKRFFSHEPNWGEVVKDVRLFNWEKKLRENFFKKYGRSMSAKEFDSYWNARQEAQKKFREKIKVA